MYRQFSIQRVIAFVLIDLFGTLGVLYLAAWLRIEINQFPPFLVSFFTLLDIDPLWIKASGTVTEILSVQVVSLVAVIWPLFMIFFSVYSGKRNENLKTELLNVFLAICTATMMLTSILYFTYRYTPRLIIPIFFALDTMLLLGTRGGLSLLRRLFSPRSENLNKLVVIGAGPVGMKIVENIREYTWSNIRIIGYLDDDLTKKGQNYGDLPVLGTLDNAEKIIADYGINECVVALPLRAHERLVEICQRLQKMGVRVFVIPDLFAFSFPNATLQGFRGIPVIGLGLPGIYGIRRNLKRIFDTIAVVIALILLAPLFLLISIMIKLDSRGPILFRQLRVGEHGQQFLMLKFRSMFIEADPNIHKKHVTHLISQNISVENGAEQGQSSLKLENDPRITRVGRFIRKTSLDELPQLFNILLGEMSLVGPRPPIPYEVDLYKDWHKKRFEAIPGLTGLWQVEGRNRVSFDEMVRLDLEYIEKQSLWLDIKIILKTPFAVLSTKGAG
jgi:exopolysaccharide biosynthesis polyprenyl glycosylphosphotransferase